MLDTELTLNIDAHQFKLSIQLLSANEIVFLLTDVTEIVKMQDDLVKSLKLKGMVHLLLVLLMKLKIHWLQLKRLLSYYRKIGIMLICEKNVLM